MNRYVIVAAVLAFLAVASPWTYAGASSEAAAVESVSSSGSTVLVQSADQESAKAEPGLTYGKVPDLPTPKTILFSIGPDDILADAEEWARRGVNAFFLDFVARDWSSDIWATDGKPWTIGASDDTFQTTCKANDLCRRIGSETFLKVAFDHPFEWFNDAQWNQIYHNFRQFAVFARDTGCTGIALDIEYVGEQYSFDWPGYSYDGYTRKDLVAAVNQHMTKAIAVLYDEFPDMVFLTFPESGLSLGSVIHAAWLEEAARRDAPGGVHYCTEYTYRSPNIRYMFGHAWACNELFRRILSPRAWTYWREKCSIAAGVWPFGFNYQSVYDPGMPLDEFRQAIAASLMMSSRYNWIYSHNCREQLIGRGLEKYTGEADLEAYLRVLAQKDMVTTPRYVALAKELRGVAQRDYAADLGVIPAVGFAGPQDVPSLKLCPAELCDPRENEERWKLALAYFNGEPVSLLDHFAPITQWMLLGPFANADPFQGHDTAYPPETEIDLNASCDGLQGSVRWFEYAPDGNSASVDFTKIFQPTEHVCAYALGYVVSPREQNVQFRIGTNDSGKLWLGGKLVYDYPFEGTAWLDRDVIPVTLPAGAAPILLKVCNGVNNWGFVFRITTPDGRPATDLQWSLRGNH